MHRIKSISDYHRLAGLPKPEHPLVSLVDYSQVNYQTENDEISMVSPYYSIAMKHGVQGKMKYGHQPYDFDEGLMSFVSPGQVISVKANYENGSKPSGWLLFIHPDFLWNTALAKKIKQYEFFGYKVNEALFLSNKEEQSMIGILKSIEEEYHSNIDRFSQNIIISHIEVLLNYADRFYQRQFITRQISNHAVLTKVEDWLNDYFQQKNIQNEGLPSVHQLAEAINMSPNYLSSLLKAQTGQNTQQHIQTKLIEAAKERLSTSQLSISEIAYELGFEHSQSFSRFFKKKVNLSPSDFRQSFN
ncbi:MULTISPECIES: helix-turn-helix domain-containing protein [Roseivirga]|nr:MULTISPECIES: response regulator transcription factor [Roseivirga]MBO6662544.1 helix-turn-helix transcriptional regulator [Roseivirga sp.]MBO6762621.1 helix-turn-helix transcriptional regulator [Roseivirga sp.]MBO6909893.1 helix-turn-helix transcriptional regulator [Roseivirga sp.]WPZ10660.1 helix-turn-helix transcriptional regulator [Roseivirga spongicola]